MFLIIYIIAGSVAFLFTAVIFATLRRTKRIPYAARLLSSGLLIFDMTFTVAVITREVVTDVVINLHCHVITMIALQLAFSTVALMSIERYVVLNWPNKYLRLGSQMRIKFTVIFIWVSIATLFLVIRYPVCMIYFDKRSVLTRPGTCNQIVTFYYTGLIGIVYMTSIVCYIKIFIVIKNKNGETSVKPSYKNALNVLKKYKATSLVILYILVISMTSLAYAVVIAMIKIHNLDPCTIRASTDIINFVNCVMDPFLYVLWFRESQMECLKLIAPCSKRIKTKIESMRIEVFGIVTKDVPIKRSNKVCAMLPKNTCKPIVAVKSDLFSV